MESTIDTKLRELLFQLSVDTKIPIEAITGVCRDAPLVAVRREFSRKARAIGASFPRIGRVLHRHHTTILNLVYGKAYNETLYRHPPDSPHYCPTRGMPQPRKKL